MKKSLLTASALLMLSQPVLADNYVTAGIGWTAAVANFKNSTEIDYGSDTTAAGLKSYSGSFKYSAKDFSGVTGALMVGHSFSNNGEGAFVEFKVAKDSTNAKTKNRQPGLLFVGNNADADDDSQTWSEEFAPVVSLKRQFNFGLGIGYSRKISRGLSVYAKISLLLGRFNLKLSPLLSTEEPVADSNYVNPLGYSKNRTLFGFGPTVGFSKQVGEKTFVNLDYTFEWYQKMKTPTLNLTAAETENPGSEVVLGYANKIQDRPNPMYHTVMVSLTQRF